MKWLTTDPKCFYVSNVSSSVHRCLSLAHCYCSRCIPTNTTMWGPFEGTQGANKTGTHSSKHRKWSQTCDIMTHLASWNVLIFQKKQRLETKQVFETTLHGVVTKIENCTHAKVEPCVCIMSLLPPCGQKSFKTALKFKKWRSDWIQIIWDFVGS